MYLMYVKEMGQWATHEGKKKWEAAMNREASPTKDT